MLGGLQAAGGREDTNDLAQCVIILICKTSHAPWHNTAMTTMGDTTTFWLDVRPPSQGEIHPGPINLHMTGKVTGLRGGGLLSFK